MTSQAVKPETLDFIFEHTKGGPEAQLHDAEGLDSKLIQIFSVASVVIGLANFSGNIGGVAATALLGIGLGAYAIAAACCMYGIWTREYRRAYHADTLWRKYWDLTPFDIEHALVEEIPDAYKHNAGQLSKKARAARFAIAALAFEVIFEGLALLAVRLA